MAGKRVRKSADVRRGELRDAAQAIALESGLLAVTQRSVAERVGVAPGLVLHYAGRMERLVAGVFAEIARDDLEAVRRAVAAADDEIARVVVLMHELVLDYRRDVALVWVDAWSLARRNDELAATLVDVAHTWESFVAGVFAAGSEAGAYHVDDAHALARVIMGATDGLSAQSAVWAGYEDETVQHLLHVVAALIRVPREVLLTTPY